jgi:hypothetical protein
VHIGVRRPAEREGEAEGLLREDDVVAVAERRTEVAAVLSEQGSATWPRARLRRGACAWSLACDGPDECRAQRDGPYHIPRLRRSALPCLRLWRDLTFSHALHS